MKTILSLMFLLISSISYSQKRIKELVIGDTLPDMEIKNIINYKTDKIKISDFNGKLLILDFWATWCSPCVASFPKIDSLQNKFKNKIQILSVTYESKEVIELFVNKIKAIKKINVTTIYGDKDLNKIFKHTYLPHYIWIDNNRKIIAITGAEELNEANILSYMNYGKVNLKPKTDVILPIKLFPNGSLFNPYIQINKDDAKSELVNVPESNLMLHSVLTKYINGLFSGVKMGDSIIRITNATIFTLYKVALLQNRLESINATTLLVEIPDTSLFEKITFQRIQGGKFFDNQPLKAENWMKENGYCYEIKVPGTLKDQKYDIMLDQVNSYFGQLLQIEGRIEKRLGKYLALVKVRDEINLATKGKNPNVEINKFFLKIQNKTINSLRTNLAQPLQLHPQIVDETNYKGNIDLELNCQLTDLKALNRELDKYGLQLIEKEKMMDVGVIRMKK